MFKKLQSVSLYYLNEGKWHLLASAVVALAAFFYLPHPQIIGKYSTFTVIATGEKNEKAIASDVWLPNVTVNRALGRGRFIERDPDQWLSKEGGLVSPHDNQPARLVWRGFARKGDAFLLLKQAWSGKARVIVNGVETTYDLYSDKLDRVRIDISPPADAASELSPAGLAAATVRFLGLLLAVLVVQWTLRKVRFRQFVVFFAGDPGRLPDLARVLLPNLVLTALVLSFLPMPRMWGYQSHITIVATGERNPASRSAEVWLPDTRDNALIFSGRFTVLDPLEWEWINNALVSYHSQPSRLEWTGLVNEGESFHLARQGWSGKVRVTVNGVESAYDLYSETGGVQRIDIPIPAGAGKVVDPGAVFRAVLRILLIFAAVGLLRGVLTTPQAMAALAPRPVLPRDLLWLFLFCLAAIGLFFAIPMGEGRYFISATHEPDITNGFYPFTVLQYAYVREFGDLPLYLPQVAFGYDPALDGQLGTNFPLRVLFLRMFPNVQVAADLLAAFQLLIAALFAGYLARMLGASRSGAAAAAASYVFGTLTLVWMGLFHSPAFFAAYAIALFGVFKLAEEEYLLGWLAMAMGLAWCVYGGHLQNAHMLYHGVAIALATIFLIRLHDGVDRRRQTLFVVLAATAILFSLVLTAPTGLAFFLLKQGSARTAATTALVPVFTLENLDFLFRVKKMHGNGNFFLSFLSLPLLVSFMLLIRDLRRLLPLFAIVLFAVAVGTGGYLFAILARVVPGWDVVSNLERLSFLVTLPLALFCGLGLTAIQSNVMAAALPPRWLTFLLPAALLVLVLELLATYGTGAGDSVLLAAVAALAVLVALALLAGLFPQYVPSVLARRWPAARLALTAFAALTGFSFWTFDLYRTAAALARPSPYFLLAGILLAVLAAALYLKRFRLVPPLLAVLLPLAALETSRLGWQPQPPKFDPRQQLTVDMIADDDGAPHRWASYCIRNDADYYFLPDFFLHVTGQRWVDSYSSFATKEYKAFWKDLVRSDRFDNRIGGVWFYHQKGDSTDVDPVYDRVAVDRIFADTSCPPPPRSNWKLLRQRGDVAIYANTDAWSPAYLASAANARRRTPLQSRFLAADVLQITGFEEDRAREGTVFLQEAFSPGWRAVDQEGNRLEISRRGIFMKIAVRPDTRRITMRFRPWHAGTYRTVSMALFVVLFLALVITLTLQVFTRRHRDGGLDAGAECGE